MFGLTIDGRFDELGATVFAGFMAAFVGVIQAAIYARQMMLQNSANKQMLFEKRFFIYRSLKKSLEAAVMDQEVSDQLAKDLIESIEMAPFLLSKGAAQHISELQQQIIVTRGMRHLAKRTNVQIIANPENDADPLTYCLKSLVDEYITLTRWFPDLRLKADPAMANLRLPDYLEKAAGAWQS